MSHTFFIGASGFSYDEWKGMFYPLRMPRRDWLQFYSRTYSSVEINSSFYGLPSSKMVQGWFDQTPQDFTFSVKMSRFVSHLKHLHMDEAGKEGVKRFFAAIEPLKQKLGVVLTQLPARAQCDNKLLEKYINVVVNEAARNTQLAIEFRHTSLFNSATFSLLEHYNIAQVWNSGPPQAIPSDRTQTADFIYVRFHGAKKLYASNYTRKELQEWSAYIASAHCAYIYFNNTLHGYALSNANTLSKLLANA